MRGMPSRHPVVIEVQFFLALRFKREGILSLDTQIYNYMFWAIFNPLNAELILICHFPVLLGDLTLMGPCIVNIFQYISNKIQRYTIYLYMKTALHVSGGTSTYHQERIQLYLQHLVFVTPSMLSAAIVEELEPVWMCCGWRTPPAARLLPRYEGKTTGCHCIHWAPDDGRENARNMLSCKQTSR
jgi:hypothetical protein